MNRCTGELPFMQLIGCLDLINILSNKYTRDDQKVIGPLYFGLPGNESLALLFNTISLQGNALNQSLFDFLFLQNRRHFLGPPKYSFTVSMTPS